MGTGIIDGHSCGDNKIGFFLMPKTWDKIIVHHSASGWGSPVAIDGWHRFRNWSGIGYHFVIYNGYTNKEDLKKKIRNESLIGTVGVGRKLDADNWVSFNEIGAHALGFNDTSIGICLIHKSLPYHPSMLASLIKLLGYLIERYKIKPSNIYGHYEVDDKKPECPSIDMKLIRGIMQACYPPSD